MRMPALLKPLGKNQLLDVILKAIDQSGWQSLALSPRHPFRLRVHGPEERGFDILVYVWNCTHGGGRARAPDEYRIQLTGVVPITDQAVTTLLLGWHEGYGVFVAFDIDRHSGQASSSPSIQVKEETLLQAHQKAFALYPRDTGEIAVAFRPEFFVEYALSSTALHKTGAAAKDLALLNDLNAVSDGEISAITNSERQRVVAQITRKYRAYDFRGRVLSAYGHRCAFCGVQLNLVDAAHIVPVADNTSTDETSNGIALCKLHHAAFDRNLLSVDENFKIEPSNTISAALRSENRHGGLPEFLKNLKPALILPSDRRDYPDRRYIARAREVRKWRP
jgi:putative restriction endonuclease